MVLHEKNVCVLYFYVRTLTDRFIRLYILGLPVMNESHSATAEIEVVTLQAVDSPGPSSSASVNRVWRIDSADITLQPCNPITDLIKTLKDSVEGIAILHYYKQHRDLGDEHRNFLVDIIISVEMRRSLSLFRKQHKVCQSKIKSSCS